MSRVRRGQERLGTAFMPATPPALLLSGKDLQEREMQSTFGVYDQTHAARPQPSLSRQMEIQTAEELLERCRQGDKEAFEQLLSRYNRPIFHLAYRLAGNYDDAHDIAAEASLRIYQVIGTCKYAVTLPAWINRIVTNVFFDMYRRSQRCPAVSLDALAEKTNGAFLAAKETGSISPQTHAEENERKVILNDAISALPDHQRKMVTMFYQEDRTYEEIADMMGISVGTVKSRLNRARLALRKMLSVQHPALMS
jgi:RNA polymerase sigma-70 factor (ECF subfamily)